MTREELNKLTNDEKKIKIAKLCGWIRDLEKSWFWTPPQKYWQSKSEMADRISRCGGIHCPPDYLFDLNAMEEARKVLSREQREIFISHLMEITLSSSSTHWCCTDASAQDQADAFLLTVG